MIYLVAESERFPSETKSTIDLFYRKGEMPMYITYDDVLQLIGLFVAIIDNHIQLALLIVTVVALLRKIKRQKDEKK